MRQVAGFALAVVFAGAVVGCGSDPPDDSRVMVTETAGSGGVGGGGLMLTGGSGGAGGSPGAAGNGAMAGSAMSGGPSGGTNGGPNPPAPAITLHTCPAQPDPPCPPMVLPGPVSVNDDAGLAALEGVTAVEGSLQLSIGVSVDALSCLESVGDNLRITGFGAETDISLWGLRHLKTVGGSIDIGSSFDRIYADCGLSRLQSLGEKYVTGGAVDARSGLAGELDLSSLMRVRHIRLENSELSRVVLPSNVTLTMGQLLLDGHPYLSEISGFSGVTIQSAGTISGTYSVRIVDNPFLSTCRANELAQLFIAAGALESTVTVMNNAPCTM